MADQAIKGQGKDTDIQKGGRQSPEGAGQSGKFQPLLSLTDQQRRNLWMDCARIRQHGICFDTTAEGFARCVADYGLRL